MMEKREIHLFIIWNKALYQKNKILNDIKRKFNIIDIYTVYWTKDKFSENLSRFYGENLPKNSHKEQHCGTGPFLCIIVEDSKPSYDVRLTSKGHKIVNTRLFDSKQLYRKWTNGGHRIHATDNELESKIQIALLFGKDINYFFDKKPSIKEKKWEKDLIGAHGWKDFTELFSIMNITLEYVILRNFYNIENQIKSLHPDVDILVSNKRLAVDILNAKPTTNKKYRTQYQVKVSNKNINFDIRFTGDDYYCQFWELNILKNRKLFKNYFIPSDEDYFYSLLYHMLIHKKQISKDYFDEIFNFSKKVNLRLERKDLIEEKLLDILTDFMLKNKYTFVEPKDLSVYFNSSLLRKKIYIDVSTKRQLLIKKDKFKSAIKNYLYKINKGLKKVKNEKIFNRKIL